MTSFNLTYIKYVGRTATAYGFLSQLPVLYGRNVTSLSTPCWQNTDGGRGKTSVCLGTVAVDILYGFGYLLGALMVDAVLSSADNVFDPRVFIRAAAEGKLDEVRRIVNRYPGQVD